MAWGKLMCDGRESTGDHFFLLFFFSVFHTTTYSLIFTYTIHTKSRIFEVKCFINKDGYLNCWSALVELVMVGGKGNLGLGYKDEQSETKDKLNKYTDG